MLETPKVILPKSNRVFWPFLTYREVLSFANLQDATFRSNTSITPRAVEGKALQSNLEGDGQRTLSVNELNRATIVMHPAMIANLTLCGPDSSLPSGLAGVGQNTPPLHCNTCTALGPQEW